ncbi:MAG: putative cytosol aminopeptidase [bacterium]|nr:MAG: putative cytosol aminopeptidase [bacterium]
MVRIRVLSEPIEKIKTEALALFLFEDGKPAAAQKAIDKKLGGRISTLIRKKKFIPKKSSTRVIETLGRLEADTVLLVGLGKKKDFTLEILRRASAKAATTLRRLGAGSFSLSVEEFADKKQNEEAMARAASEGIILSLYRYTEYLGKKPDNDAGDIRYVAFAQKKSAVSSVKSAVAAAQKICRAVFLARDLQNHPANKATPSFIAEKARSICREVGMRCRVLNKNEIERLKMGAFLSVAQGSAQPPKFIVMEHMKGKKNEKPVVFVGKGLTFDSGGISIKPSQNMDEMKFDMSGAATVIGAMYAIGLLKLKKNVVGLVAATENMPGGKAVKPGDIVRAMSGKTIEVLNTDAEGRLVLADALHYAKKYKPSVVIDLATLTGSCLVALGTFASGLLGNDQKLMDTLQKAGERTGERCWPLPLWDEYGELIKSKVADLKNIGGRYGGTITAAAFLKEFTDYPWAHLDIAGTAFSPKPQSSYVPAGGAGFGVRQLVDFLMHR